MTELIVSRMVSKASGMPTAETGEQTVHDRQSQIQGWDQNKLNQAKIFCIGSGGLGGKELQNLARLGVGHLVFCDHDIVELPNLHTQSFYLYQKFQKKAFALFENLKAECTHTTILEAYALSFQEVIQDYPNALNDVNLILCLVDNDETRHDACRYGLEHNIPVIYSAVSKTTRNGYVFVQDGNACFNCINPRKGEQKQACREPSVIYIHTAIIGIVTFAVVSMILGWELPWNYYELFMDDESRVITRQKKDDCEVCQG